MLAQILICKKTVFHQNDRFSGNEIIILIEEKIAINLDLNLVFHFFLLARILKKINSVPHCV